MKAVMIGIIRVYQATHGSLFQGYCRFHPTCSQYAVEAIQHWGLGKGIWLAVKRVGRCHPFRPGGYDPVPVGREA